MPARRGWPGMEPGHAFKDTDLAGLPAAGYFRVSSNPDETEQRSVDDQETDYLGWTARTAVKSGPADLFKDDDRSASMFATRQRENFARLREAIEAERYKVVWFWATSRQTRGDVNIYELAKVSADHGVLWCVGGQLLNPANEDDLLFLGIHHLMDRQYSWRISKDSRRGHKSIAHDGKPAGRAIYGYRRVYDHETLGKHGKPKFIRDEPNVYDGNGQAIVNSPAYVVREIYDRIEHGHKPGTIARSFEDRGIPIPAKPRRYTDRPCRWSAGTVLYIATNPAYIGKRVFHAESQRVEDRHAAVLDGVEARWPALVTEEQWFTVQRIIAARPRKGQRPGRVGYLLSGAVLCSVCRMPVYSGHAGGMYTCQHRGHVSIRVDWLEEYVEDRVVSFLADADVSAHLRQARDHDDAVASAARADAERLRLEIEKCRVKGEDPDADAEFWERRSRALGKKLEEAEELARPASLSPLLAGMLGPDAADRWWKLRTQDLAVARQLITEIAEITVRPGRRGGDARYRTGIDAGRVGWRWLTGPGGTAEPVFGEPSPRIRDAAADALRANPEQADRALVRELSCSGPLVPRVRRELENAGEIPVIRRRGKSGPVNHGYQPDLAT